MRGGCSTGVSRRGVVDSGCHFADRAQAEQGRGRAAHCSFAWMVPFCMTMLLELGERFRNEASPTRISGIGTLL